MGTVISRSGQQASRIIPLGGHCGLSGTMGRSAGDQEAASFAPILGRAVGSLNLRNQKPHLLSPKEASPNSFLIPGTAANGGAPTEE